MAMEVSSPIITLTSATAGLAEYVDELPAYTPPYTRRDHSAEPLVPRPLTEHVYNLMEKSRTWVTLKLYSSAKSPHSLPTYFEKEKITGLLEINAEKGDSIHSISAVITGRIITGSNSSGCFTFLNESSLIWSKSGDFSTVQSSYDGASISKLRGCYRWPLSLSLPRSVDVSNGSGGTDSFPLPETFLERQTCASVHYDFTLLICRGKLRADSLLKTAFGYIPSSRPEEAPLLRQLAYQYSQPIPGPRSDPDGWHTLASVKVQGSMKNDSRVGVEFLFSVAKPLSFTRGSVIPCYLVVKGSNQEALERFAVPSALSFHLQRHVSFTCSSSPTSALLRKDSTTDIGSAAIWWPAIGSLNDSNTRNLEGEIKLSKDIRPTTIIGHFRLTYQVAFRSFNVEHFRPDNRVSLSEVVEITTMYPNGPRPRTYAPPVYIP